jgi:hypothetical protein
VDTSGERLRQWWDSLSDDQRAGLLAADLKRPLSKDLVEVVTQAKAFGPAILSWWVLGHEAAATWHATSRMTAFVDAKRAD